MSTETCSVGNYRCKYTAGDGEGMPEKTLTYCLAPGVTVPTKNDMLDMAEKALVGTDSTLLPEEVALKDVVCTKIMDSDSGQVGTTITQDEESQGRMESGMSKVAVTKPTISKDLKHVLDKNMARSCGPTWDVSDANQLLIAKCEYRGPHMGPDGKLRNTRMKHEFRLHTCDRNDEDYAQTNDDVINISHFKFGGDEKSVKKSGIVCDFHSMPHS